MTCPFCGSCRIIGCDDRATCADCGRFVHRQRDAAEQVFDRIRAELSPAERRIEAAIREGRQGLEVELIANED